LAPSPLAPLGFSNEIQRVSQLRDVKAVDRRTKAQVWGEHHCLQNIWFGRKATGVACISGWLPKNAASGALASQVAEENAFSEGCSNGYITSVSRALLMTCPAKSISFSSHSTQYYSFRHAQRSLHYLPSFCQRPLGHPD
jgi:hypothetical protein